MRNRIAISTLIALATLACAYPRVVRVRDAGTDPIVDATDRPSSETAPPPVCAPSPSYRFGRRCSNVHDCPQQCLYTEYHPEMAVHVTGYCSARCTAPCECPDDWTCAPTSDASTSGTCECRGFPLDGGTEICDGRDNNCDALVVNVTSGGPCLAELAQGDHSCARTTTGEVWCWGPNDQGCVGAPANEQPERPVRVGGLARVRAVTPGGRHTCALLRDTTVACFGTNTDGQLGDDAEIPDPRTDHHVPSLVVTRDRALLRDVVGLALGGLHSCALVRGGAVYCWGLNNLGQLGTGYGFDGLGSRSAAVPVPGLSGVTAIYAGNGFTCAVVAPDASLRCWGINHHGQLGQATPINGSGLPHSRVPIVFPGLQGVVHLALGTNFGCALVTDGSVQCWGDNSSGQLGDGAACEGDGGCDRLSPSAVALRDADGGALRVRAITAGSHHACALLDDGTVRCWG